MAVRPLLMETCELQVGHSFVTCVTKILVYIDYSFQTPVCIEFLMVSLRPDVIV